MPNPSAQPPEPILTEADRKAHRRRGVAYNVVEGFFDLLAATDLGLILFGGLALVVGLPLLVVFGGAAWAARLRRKQEPHAPRIGLGAILTPAVLLVILLVMAAFGALSYTAFRTGHPIAMAVSYAAALVTLGFVGFMAMQRRAERRA